MVKPSFPSLARLRGRHIPFIHHGVVDEHDQELEIGEVSEHSVGATAVTVSMKRSSEHMGLKRTLLTLSKVNQTDGFDCQGCAWPDPKERSPFEFCENGAKAVAEEATKARITSEFWSLNPLSSLVHRSGYWLGQQGRLTEPVYRAPGADHYVPIAWEQAYDIIASHLSKLDNPNEVSFYTSGRTSNEAAFVYQLMAREFGTNNLPDCSNMCHESTTVALSEAIGIGKASVTLDDVYRADLILVIGQNPGTNHPRMLTALEKAKQNGARIVAINPLPEAGLGVFHNPQTPKGLTVGTKLADRHLPVRLSGDRALFALMGKLVLDADRATAAKGAQRGTLIDWDFLTTQCSGVEEYLAHLDSLEFDEVLSATGLEQGEIEALVDLYLSSDRVIACWAMGLTQHKDSVATIGEVVNFMLLRGNIGKPGAGLFPVRGHSNVQGDRTMGIWEQMPPSFLDALEDEFGFCPPREHGLDVVATIEAMVAGKVKAFFAMGGNFAAATPDTAVTEAALSTLDLTVQVSTKLNRSHVIAGTEALILPTLGRTEIDQQASGPQAVTVEDSLCMVHRSSGRLKPASTSLRSEVAIVTELAERLLPGSPVDWAGMRGDYRVIRSHIEAVVPGFVDFEQRLDQPGGFALPHPPRDSRTFPTATGKARFTSTPVEVITLPPGRLLLQTLRSHDQFNTTIYGLEDRYRGVSGGRHVVFVNPADLEDLGLAAGSWVDLISHFEDHERRAESFQVVAYPTARGCAAAYYPETNGLLSLGAVARRSNTPVMKSLEVSLVPGAAREH